MPEPSYSILFSLEKWKNLVTNGLEFYTERFSPGNTKGPLLKFHRYGHCVVNYNRTYLYIIGGRDGHKGMHGGGLIRPTQINLMVFGGWGTPIKI